MAERPALICFAGDAWDGNPHSRHHLMRLLAARLRRPVRRGAADAGTDGRRSHGAAARLAQAAGAGRPARGGAAPVRPAAAARAAVGPGRPRAAAAGARAPRSPGPRAVPGWASAASPGSACRTWRPLRGEVGDRASILYYQDRYDAFTGVDGERLRRHLASLAAGCDVSRGDRPSRWPGPARARRRPGGRAARRRRRPLRGGGPEPPADLAGLERPLVGCVGLIDDHLDVPALLATATPWSAAPSCWSAATTSDDRAPAHPRMRLLGRRPYETMPAYLARLRRLPRPVRALDR